MTFHHIAVTIFFIGTLTMCASVLFNDLTGGK